MMTPNRALLFATLALDRLLQFEQDGVIKYEIRQCRATLAEMVDGTRLSQEAKRFKIRRMLCERPDLSFRQIARYFGVSPQTVSNVSREMKN